ncbi:STAS domain-containing protein [Streptacidiphilus sp. PAMC 29251]
MTAQNRPRLTVRRQDTPTSALVTLVGEIDLDALPLLRDALESRLSDGVLTIDVDLAGLSFCDVSGLGGFLGASDHASAAGVSLLLHEPGPALVRLLRLTGTGFLLAVKSAPLKV